jgi:hypothetical protein
MTRNDRSLSELLWNIWEIALFIFALCAGVYSVVVRLRGPDAAAAIPSGLLTALILFWYSDRRKFRSLLRDATQGISDGLMKLNQNSNLLKALITVDESTRDVLLEHAAHHGEIVKINTAMNPQFQTMYSDWISENRQQLKYLSRSSLNLPMRDVAYINGCLFNEFKTMNAVSDRAINSFWQDPLGAAYHEKIVDSARSRVSAGSTVTRIFILDLDEDLEGSDLDKVVSLLTTQIRDGVGVAIAFSQDMSKEILPAISAENARLRRPSVSPPFIAKLDFALFDRGSRDGDRAVSFFSDQDARNSDNRFLAAFSTADREHENNKLIAFQRKLWTWLIRECWIASKDFYEKLGIDEAERKEIERQSAELNSVLKTRTGWIAEDRVFPFLLQDQGSIYECLELAKNTYWKRNAAE